MSYGGGYQKTGYGAQGGDDGGGFMAGSQQGSQGGGGGSKSYGDESLRPVTIKQLADWSEPFPGADIQIDGAPLTQLTLVGQIRKINPQATNITYTLDDGTATIDVKKWVDAERAEDGADGAQFAEDQYVRIWGRLKSFNGKKHVGAHFIRAIEDYNEVNYHLVEAAYVHLYITKGPPVPGQAAAEGQTKQQTGGDGESMFVDDGYGGGGGGGGAGGGEETPQQKLARASPLAKKVFAYLNNTPGGNEGVSAHLIASGTGLSTREVFTAADELNQSGLVYTTVDDETFAILEYS
ncbi:replication protein A, subunit RPA32 [Coniochaeta ligniaria NRRL 30616]|uniref:Replication protein A, subunit RPA32 n=1 Tax=Coniochaeta ligniaria NRRL 30616 TaxID=1408157 RepID=A0A1J7JFG5_9PEZI|nr:replication protein A, subunit RPA32 [Coniochaeta ligniaria NRRL 30616]